MNKLRLLIDDEDHERDTAYMYKTNLNRCNFRICGDNLDLSERPKKEKHVVICLLVRSWIKFRQNDGNDEKQ